jgi:imidazolonepropionase-like amidohydrolase
MYRRLVVLILSLHVVAVAAPLDMAAAQSPRAVALTNITLIDGTGSAPQPGMTVLVTNGRIADVFPTGSRALPEGTSVQDLPGRFVIPGLIDAHVHVATDPAGRDSNAVAFLRGALRGGVTSVRDMAGDALVLAPIARRSREAGADIPRVYFSAVMAGPAFFQDPRTQSAAHGGSPGSTPWLRAMTDTTDIALAVREAKATGATGVKLYADLAPPLVARIAAEAHAQGMRVWSHAMIYPTRPGEATRAGVDVLSHALLFFWEGVRDAPANYHQSVTRNAYDSVDAGGAAMRRLFTLMRERGAVLDATLFISSRLETARPGTSGLADPARAVLWMYDLVRNAHAAGVTVSAGTDGMMPGAPDGVPNIHSEMQLLVARAGFTRLEAIRAATLNSARALGQERDLGSIVKGKIADLVVLRADPCDNIRNTTNIEGVVKDGALVWRNTGK